MPNRQHTGAPSTAPTIAEPSLAERARTLVSLGRIGSLSTHSQKLPGFPFGSMMPYAPDEKGRPVFFVSSMAMHTQNLRQDHHASLLVTQSDVEGDPLGASRVTLLGSASEVPASEVKDLYLARHENAKYWQDYTDFTFQRLDIEGVYFIGGFGVMGWIPAGDYLIAMPDPLAEVAGEIINHMNTDHTAALLEIARHAGGEKADAAFMTAVDRLGFHVRLRTDDRIYSERIPFLHEVKNKMDARTMLVEMVKQARDQANTAGSAPIVPTSSAR